MTLSLLPDRAFLNDANPHLITFYKWLKHGLHISIDMRNDERLFYAHRDRFNRLLGSTRANTVEAASLFYYLNRTGYNGLCRFNRQGQFNVPFGKYRRITYIRDFTPYAETFSAWTFGSTDFESVPLTRSDFVYVDPPYDVEFTQYAKQGFAWDDQIRTAEWLSRHRGPVVLSNQATTRIVNLYRQLGFGLRFLTAPRRISCTGDRRPAREVLALKNLEIA